MIARGIRRLAFLAGFALAAAGAQGDTFDLAAYRGKVVYLDFWASWCTPCLQSFPWMKKMQETYGREGLVIVAVNADSRREDADAFLRKTSPNFTIAYDPDGKLFGSYRLMGLPTAILFDRHGVEQSRHVGWREERRETYEQAIRSVLHAR